MSIRYRYILSVTLLFGSSLLKPIRDPDLWWHITSGKWILAHHSLPFTDPWGLFSKGTPWIAYSWIHEVCYAFVERYSGILGLLSLKFILGILLSFSAIYCFSRMAKDLLLGILLASSTIGISYFFFSLRPQSVSWICLLLIILGIDNNKTLKITFPLLLQISIIGILWANTHITTVFGLLICLFWPLRMDKLKPSMWFSTVVSIAFLCSTLITPYFGKEWLVFLNQSNDPFLFSSISEFQPATILQTPTAVLCCLIGFLAVLLHNNPKAFPPNRLFIVVMFTLGGLASVKFLPYAGICISALIASAWSTDPDNSKENFGSLGTGLKIAETKMNNLSAKNQSIIFCIIFLITASNLYKSYKHPLNDSFVPVAAVDYMQKKNLPFPVANDFGDGGYLIYRYADQNGMLSTSRFPIDGRTNVAPKRLLLSAMKAYKGKSNWESYFAAVKPNTVFWRNASPLTEILKQSPSWCHIYKSNDTKDGAAIFLNRKYWEQHTSALPGITCD